MSTFAKMLGLTKQEDIDKLNEYLKAQSKLDIEFMKFEAERCKQRIENLKDKERKKKNRK